MRRERRVRTYARAAPRGVYASVRQQRGKEAGDATPTFRHAFPYHDYRHLLIFTPRFTTIDYDMLRRLFRLFSHILRHSSMSFIRFSKMPIHHISRRHFSYATFRYAFDIFRRCRHATLLVDAHSARHYDVERDYG